MSINRRTALGTFVSIASIPLLKPHSSFALPPMRIGVIGAGWLGGTVGRRWVEAGHEVMFSSRHPDELQSVVQDLGSRASTGLPTKAAQFGKILLFAVPYVALPQLGRDLHPYFQGKIVLDACNPPLSGGTGPLIEEAHTNGVAKTTAKYLDGARVVRAFNCTDATVIERSGKANRPRVGIPMASDDKDAMEVAAGLVADAGCDPVVLGDLAAARILEQGHPGWRLHVSAAELRQRLGLTPVANE